MKFYSERTTVETRIPAKEVLGIAKEKEPISFEKYFELVRTGLKAELDEWMKNPLPNQAYWQALSGIKTFSPDWRDINPELDYSKVYKEFLRDSSQSSNFSFTFYLMQLFPEQRKIMFNQTGIDPTQMPQKVHMGELILINTLLVLSTAQPERLPEYTERAHQEFEEVKKWITESDQFDNQLGAMLRLAANFLFLCPEYKSEMQALLEPQMSDIEKELKSSKSYSREFQLLCNLEVIFGTDNFVIDGRGNLVRQPGKVKLQGTRPLPDRSTT